MHHSILIQNYGDSIRACPVIQRGQEHCLAVPQPAGDYTPADHGYGTLRLKRRGTSCPQLYCILSSVLQAVEVCSFELHFEYVQSSVFAYFTTR